MMGERPPQRRGKTTHFKIVGTTVLDGYITINVDTDNDPMEVFIVISKHGSILGGLFHTIAILISVMLQKGCTTEDVVRALIGSRFEPFGDTDDEDIPYAFSVVDYLARRLALDYGSPRLRRELKIVRGQKPDRITV